jgi:hypothetical protein
MHWIADIDVLEVRNSILLFSDGRPHKVTVSEQREQRSDDFFTFLPARHWRAAFPSGPEAQVAHAVHGALAAQRLVGAVVLVYQHGQALCRMAAGWADREAQLAMAQDAVFRWASASKPVVSAAVLRLVAQGGWPWTTPSRPGCRTFARACRMAAKRASRCASC